MAAHLPPGACLPAVAAQPAAQDWLRLLANLGRAERTIDAYGRGLDQYLSFCSSRDVDALTATLEDVSLFVRWQRGEAEEAPWREPVSNSTLIQRITAVRLWYDHLVCQRLREENPVPRGERLGRNRSHSRRIGVGRALVRKVEQLPHIPTDADWRRVLHAAAEENLRNRLMFALAYFGALRRQEIVGLAVGDVDYARRLITVRADTTKTGRGRVVSYPASAGSGLVRYMQERRALSPMPGALFLSTSNRNRGRPELWPILGDAADQAAR